MDRITRDGQGNTERVRSKHGKPLVCCTCKRDLDPERDAIVFLGWGEREDGAPGPGWVAALCAPTPEQVGRGGSPCVAEARRWAEAEGVAFVPSDLDGWQGGDPAPRCEGSDPWGVRYAGPELEDDATLAALVGLPTWRLELEADLEARAVRFRSRLQGDNAVVMREWHGHVRSWTVPIMVKADAEDLVEAVRPLVARVAAGYSSRWDGSNMVARFSAEAEQAREELDRVAETWPDRNLTAAGGLWDAWEWFEGAPPDVAPGASDQDLAALAEDLQGEAHGDGLHLWNLPEYLAERRTKARAEAAAAPTFTTAGPVRGTCGHRHPTLAEAEACLQADRDGCAAQGGYSDRVVLEADADGYLCDPETGEPYHPHGPSSPALHLRDLEGGAA